MYYYGMFHFFKMYGYPWGLLMPQYLTVFSFFFFKKKLFKIEITHIFNIKKCLKDI